MGRINAPFGEQANAQTQLLTLANVTKRFIRESTTGRPFAVEIRDIAEEMASPSWMETDVSAFLKLQNMRNQLLEIQGIATSIIESPQGFDKAKVIGAREDLLVLGPLLDNYDVVIKSYERGLGQTDKPDPSMFERGLGNAQGSAAAYAGGRALGPPSELEGKNMTLLGYDTGVPRGALYANQGAPITRRRN